MSRQLLEAKLQVRPRAWERTTGTQHRVMTRQQRQYYVGVFMALYDVGMRPVDPEAELAIWLTFRYRGRRWLDTDNMAKGMLDAGQLSKWRTRSMTGMMLLKDFWDDRQFSFLRTRRIRNADEDSIEVSIWHVDDPAMISDDKSADWRTKLADYVESEEHLLDCSAVSDCCLEGTWLRHFIWDVETGAFERGFEAARGQRR